MKFKIYMKKQSKNNLYIFTFILFVLINYYALFYFDKVGDDIIYFQIVVAYFNNCICVDLRYFHYKCTAREKVKV